MAIKIAIVNQKDGEGKTTTAISLANGMFLKNKKILVIDLDSQCNSTNTMNGITKGKETLINCFEGSATIEYTIQHTE